MTVGESSPNREALRELTRDRARQRLKNNQAEQDARVDRHRHPPRQFNIGDCVFVIKCSQATGKLDPGMRGPYKVIKVLPSGRYTLRLLSGGYGKITQAAAQYMVPWRGEWCPESCAAFFENDDDESETCSTAAQSTGTGSSMPLLDVEMKAGPSTQDVPETSGVTKLASIEDDASSGEAV